MENMGAGFSWARIVIEAERLMSNGSDDRSRSTASTASSLIARVQARDPEAWRRLTELYGPMIYHWCRRSGLKEADASDVFQDVFVTLHRAVGRFDPHSTVGTFRGWLWTVTRSRVRDHWRRQAGRESAVGGTDAQVQMAMLPDPLGGESVPRRQRRFRPSKSSGNIGSNRPIRDLERCRGR